MGPEEALSRFDRSVPACASRRLFPPRFPQAMGAASFLKCSASPGPGLAGKHILFQRKLFVNTKFYKRQKILP